MEYRKTSQYLMPAVKPDSEPGRYDIYPVFSIEDGKVYRGISSLAEIVSGEDIILIDGYIGVFFEQVKEVLGLILRDKYNISASWINTEIFLKKENEIRQMISPSVGGDDPLFGKRTDLKLEDFFTGIGTLSKQTEIPGKKVIIYGIGAALFAARGFLIYLDLPKNELQSRSRAGVVTNLGASNSGDPKLMYKRFYFVDWIVLNNHKKSIIGRIDILADTQRNDDITWISGDDFRNSLYEMSRNLLRARPWFEPGAWGGTWIKDNIHGVNKEVPNYAWSFELITPENGLVLESNGLMVEFSFDFLMCQEAETVLGDCYGRFGSDFPIRFDFLDTFNGGNLSIQCHPRPGYIKDNFGEDFTQEEAYYILDTKDDAVVYLGFCKGIDRDKFGNSLKGSYNENRAIDIEEFVQTHPANKHDLYLIPYGTVHGSGINNLVLEISSTPYIFTFKMYDWLRPDLDGKPRPLNIQRGLDNLFFERSGSKVKDELISKPVLIDEGNGWQLYHLPTHLTHLYDVHRYHFIKSVEIETRNKCLVCSLVEGASIKVKTKRGYVQHFSFAETFIIPAAADNCTVNNESDGEAMLIIAFVK